jgi:hypothetical protein
MNLSHEKAIKKYVYSFEVASALRFTSLFPYFHPFILSITLNFFLLLSPFICIRKKFEMKEKEPNRCRQSHNAANFIGGDLKKKKSSAVVGFCRGNLKIKKTKK